MEEDFDGKNVFKKTQKVSFRGLGVSSLYQFFLRGIFFS